MEKMPTFFEHVRNSGLVEMKKLKWLVESLRVRKRIVYEPRADYRPQVGQLKKVAGYDRLPPLEQYVAREFLRLDWLNVWQISQLIEGRCRFTLGEYQIIDSLGQGGYAHVFLAKSNKTSDLAAIKVFQSAESRLEGLSRFLREAMLQESISHKNIVRLINCEQDGNVDYLVFEYMAGGDVRRLIRKEVQLPILQSARIISQTAEALAYLHQKKIVHRDVKPANILLCSSGNAKWGNAKLGDLGLCGFFDERTQDDPRFGKLVGTADYIAPDHILNPRKPSPQWDIYSLGCTFYQMVTGTVPFPKDNSREKIMAHLRAELIDPRVFREDLPEELSRIITRMMAKSPASRFQTMAEVQASLAPWCDEITAVVTGLADEPEHVVVRAEILQKLRDYSNQAHEKTEGGSQVESLDLDAVRDVPLEIEIYELQKTEEDASGDFSFELPVEQIDDVLPVRFDQKSLFEFVSTFEEAIRIPIWRLDMLSKLRRSLPLRLRLRFAKREVVIRRFARQMRNGYVLDPRCGGERSRVKAEPTSRWYLWWLLTARPYDVYPGFAPKFGHAEPGYEDEETTQSPELLAPVAKRQGKEYIRVRLPGHTKPLVIEVPPMIMNPADMFAHGDDSSAPANDGLRPLRPFEPLILLFWLSVAVFVAVLASAFVGIYAILNL